MNETSERFSLTRLLLVVMLTALGACAAVGILVFLFGEFEETEMRMLATCATIAYTSLTGLGCAVALEREVLKLLAHIGMAVSFLAFLSLTAGIWADFFESQEYGKACLVLSLFAGALAHTSLLSLARLRPGYAWTRYGTAASAFLLVSLISYIFVFEAFEQNDELYARAVGVFSILTALGTLTVPILHRLSGIPLERIHETVRAEEIELFCPRCHRRQKIFIGSGYCQSCQLEINVEIKGWEERPEGG